MSHLGKVLMSVLTGRLRAQTEEHLADEQAGFRKDRSTVQQILTLRLISNTKAAVRVHGELGLWFYTNRDTRQGDPIYPNLFITLLERVLDKTRPRRNQRHKNQQSLRMISI